MSLEDLLVELEAARSWRKQAYGSLYAPSISFLGIAGPERMPSIKSIFRSEKTRVIDWDFVDIRWERIREYQYVLLNHFEPCSLI